jgi:hypothetical protein
MAHRGTAHARRRVSAGWERVEAGVQRSTGPLLLSEWDATTYDDVVPHRLRGTLVLDDEGEPVELAGLVADRSPS